MKYIDNCKDIPVMVTGIGSTTAISVVKALRQQKEVIVKLIGVDINRKNEIAGSQFCDRFYTVPEAVAANYITELIKICQFEGVLILFPIIDIELEVIA